MMLRYVLVFGLFTAGAAFAQNDVAKEARAAADALEAASVSLHDAEGARDRVRALTATVQAYEDGLEAMRDGLRRATVRERQLNAQLEARNTEIAQLLSILQTIGSTPSPIMFLHPQGPVGTARSGMILAEVTPALSTRAAALRADLEEIQTLRLLQANAVETLQAGLAGIQDARTKLSQAIANRTDLPQRFTEDPVRTAILISSTETLSAFASGLSEITTDESGDSTADISIQKGALNLPVQGRILHQAGQFDAAGIKRPGLILATRPRALVTSPSAATIRYLGPLLDLGNVVILEPQADLLFVFAGLDQVFGESGQVIPQGAPIGLMGGENPEIGAILSLSGDGTGTDRSETLYIEVRQGNEPVDPEIWFQTEKDG
jgi:septal ring factor EnvC (AmiA/AmiB activator)